MSTSSSEILQGRSRRSGLLLVSVLVFCVLLLSAQAPGGGNRRGTLLQSWILSVSAPIVGAVSAVSRAASGMADTAAETFSAREENAGLKRELAEKNRELFRLRAEVSQAAREKLLLASGDSLPSVRMAAPVLLIESRAGTHSALVGAGSSSGAVPGMPL